MKWVGMMVSKAGRDDGEWAGTKCRRVKQKGMKANKPEKYGKY